MSQQASSHRATLQILSLRIEVRIQIDLLPVCEHWNRDTYDQAVRIDSLHPAEKTAAALHTALVVDTWGNGDDDDDGDDGVAVLLLHAEIDAAVAAVGNIAGMESLLRVQAMMMMLLLLMMMMMAVDTWAYKFVLVSCGILIHRKNCKHAPNTSRSRSSNVSRLSSAPVKQSPTAQHQKVIEARS